MSRRYNVGELYHEAKEEGIPFLFSNGVTYPTIEGNESNFLEDYLEDYEKLDHLFYRKYSSMIYLNVDNDIPLNEWKEDVNSILYYYLDGWARLYYALSLAYNPIYNVDGKTETTVEGKTEGLSGSDSIEHDIKQHRTVNAYGEDKTTYQKAVYEETNTHYDVANDSTEEKETAKDVTSIPLHSDEDTRASRSDTVTTDPYKDVDTTKYGKINEVDYTTTETRQGNIGVTMTQQMLEREWEFRKHAFWENVFRAIVKELLYW